MSNHLPSNPRSSSEPRPTPRGADASTVSSIQPSLPSGRALPDDVQDLLPPGTTLGNYRIDEVLGVGGIGEVYLAEHTLLGRKVALKRLRAEYGRSRAVVSRFFDEARAANQIAHENIVEITDFVEDPTDGAYLIMEVLRGEDLGMLLEREHALPAERTVAIMRQVASGLAAAHRVGVVHRDLKPDNVFLIERAGRADFVKLLDFGVAKLGDDVRTKSAHKTAAGTVLGTPAYMSPEQALGRGVDARTDVYALGVILYELLTGTLPFHGETLGEFVVAHATETPRPPSAVEGLAQVIPPRLEALIMRCLAKEPEARPSSMEEVEAELAAIADAGFRPSAYSLPPAAPVRKRSGGAGLAIGGAIAIALLGAGAAAAWWLWPAPAPTVTPLAPRAEVPVAAAAERPAEPAEPAAPAVEAPAPIPAGVEPPPTVTITFRSEPPGAEVWREGAAARLGVTPFSTPLPRADEPLVFELRLEGHETLRQEVALVADAETSAALRPSRASAGGRRSTGTTTSEPGRRRDDPGRRGVLDF
ncbi:MAG: serine/threonine protein kinase [Sandaracinaceae bacterium]|nr:serine/threonine protein kinase [Sandaracinaceae bacterium]